MELPVKLVGKVGVVVFGVLVVVLEEVVLELVDAVVFFVVELLVVDELEVEDEEELDEDPQDTTQAGIIHNNAPTPNAPPKIFNNFLFFFILITFYYPYI